MVWGLKQGMLGMSQGSLAPSLTALGPNRYLREKDFLIMLGIALVAHLVVLLIASLMPDDKVTDIPVRALSFKIGGQDRIAAFGVPMGVGAPVSAPQPAPAASTSWRATPVQPPVVTPKPLEPVRPKPQPKTVSIVPPSQRQMPEENRATLEPLPAAPEPAPTPAPVAPTPMPAALPDLTPLTQVASPAIAPTPQRFIREVGAAPAVGAPGAQANTGLGVADGAVGGQGLENSMTPVTAEEIRLRYEQQISRWIQQHKLYPAAAMGHEGKAIVRMRIDRSGYVRYYALEQSSGNQVLDVAAVDMIRRANPVPAVPPNYPAGNLIEFLIPITFRVPR